MQTLDEIKAPHGVRDNEKLESIMQSMRNGDEITPVVVDLMGRALCGSHRIAAYNKLTDAGEEIESPEVIELTDEEMVAADEWAQSFAGPKGLWGGIDLYYDFDLLCRAVVETTTREEVKAALADQI